MFAKKSSSVRSGGKQRGGGQKSAECEARVSPASVGVYTPVGWLSRTTDSVHHSKRPAPRQEGC